MKISPYKYFIKSFGIDSVPIPINNKLYWELRDDEKSYFYLEGYLKNDGDSIMILPKNYQSEGGILKAYKLFDFSLTNQKTWKFIFKIDKKNSFGGSVTFLNRSKIKSDTLFNYALTPFVFHSKINNYDYNNQVTFNISVSKTNGIESISRYNPINHSLIFEAIIYPERKFVNNGSNLIVL